MDFIRRPRTFGLSVPGSTAAANTVGRSFEGSVNEFDKYLKSKYDGRFVLTNKTNGLPDDYKIKLSQFFALSSDELATTEPADPQVGDIMMCNDEVQIYTPSHDWKTAQEGIEPDHTIYCPENGRIVLVESKYGDTEGNAHIERAGARATSSFRSHVDALFEGKARYMYIFSGPMVTARAGGAGPKTASRGAREGKVVQTEEQRIYASARYHRQMKVLFSSDTDYTFLWADDGIERIEEFFESNIKPWLEGKD